MKYLTTLIIISTLLIFSSCQRDDATVVSYEKSLNNIECLTLSPLMFDKELKKTLLELYSFQKECEYELRVSQKSGIVCNSNQNAQKKALRTFPSTYLRLDVYRSEKIVYSYYRDLDVKLKYKDIEQGFLRLKNDIGLK